MDQEWNFDHKITISPLNLIVIKLQQNRQYLLNLLKLLKDEPFVMKRGRMVFDNNSHFVSIIMNADVNYKCSFCNLQNICNHIKQSQILRYCNDTSIYSPIAGKVIFSINKTCLPFFLMAVYLSHFHEIFPIFQYGLSNSNSNLSILSTDILMYISNVIISLCTIF